jgi:thioredoxin-related protein
MMKNHFFRRYARVIVPLALAGLIAACDHMAAVQPVDLDWPTDLPQAEAQARAQKKLVLVDFGGSDWCPDCALMTKKVYYSPEFKAYAQSNLALVALDYPEKKPQPEEVKKTNKELAQKYEVDGYPTMLVLDGDGKVLGKQVGLLSADPKPADFIAWLEKIKTPAK